MYDNYLIININFIYYYYMKFEINLIKTQYIQST